ncbi:hypothetical protein RBB50_000873 [Rhinocladiella similis]
MIGPFESLKLVYAGISPHGYGNWLLSAPILSGTPVRVVRLDVVNSRFPEPQGWTSMSAEKVLELQHPTSSNSFDNSNIMASWVPIDQHSDFSLQNLPFGVFSTQSLDQRIGIAVGNYVLDMKALAQNDVFDSLNFDTATLQTSRLNQYAALGRNIHRSVRTFLQNLLSAKTTHPALLRDNNGLRSTALVSMKDVKMHLPMAVGDYTDFFVVPYHAQNCTDIFRPGQTLPDAFFEQPLGYHGRASSVVVSGTPVQRPRGQFVGQYGKVTFEPSQKLDYEVEFAAFVIHGQPMGESIKINDAEDLIFGFVLLNDWSARDIQRREAAPLGPFNGKNFCTTISPWIVSPDALEPYRTAPLRSVGLI